ncbi:cell division protein ZapA [Leuconostoc rapi]|uniref:cell division protein ZapA n=1 Tax=Leuconostoc rapi TaxID=1406906 RepID=UPI0019596DEF|nr:cell division protein ZapA [Leuconostoc rapi]MBM7436056.1 cell division protein ZapA [Leuconostoc rapi]
MVIQNEKKHFKANLAGKDYTISGHATLPHVKATETIFNKQWQQIKTVAPNLSPNDQAVLLTFNTLSDQLYKQAEIDKLQAQVSALQDALEQEKKEQKSNLKRGAKSAIGSIIDDAKNESQARATDKLFKQGTHV